MSNLPNIDKIMHMSTDARVAFLEALSDEQVIALRDAANMAAGVSNDKHFDIHELDIRHIRNQQAFEALFNLCCRRLWGQQEFQNE